jgi:hypothetical protein
MRDLFEGECSPAARMPAGRPDTPAKLTRSGRTETVIGFDSDALRQQEATLKS